MLRQSFLPEDWGWPCESAYAEPSTWLDSIHPEDREHVLTEFDRASVVGASQSEYRIIRRDGEVRWIFVRTFPYREVSGTLKRVIGIAQDCTARILAQKTQFFLASIVECSDDSIVGTDLQGKILSWNHGAELLFGYTPEEAIGKQVTLLFSSELARSIIETLQKFQAHERIERFDSVRVGKDGVPIDVSVILSPIKDTFGKVQGISAIYRDVTDKNRVEAELRRAMEAAESANRAKSEFLANMSHEIRTPMNGIMGMAEVLADTDLSDDQRDYLQIIQSSAELMLTVVNDILDFSKIEAGRLELDPISFNLRDLVEEATRSLAVKAHEKNLELTYNVQTDVPERVVGDTVRIRQILANLLSNAIKFTSQGEVTLDIDLQSRHDNKLMLHFSVRDTGIGIPEGKERLIFSAFSQVDGSTTRKYGGTGLGLTISSRLVEAMGGKIWVESELGRGSCFQFTACLGVSTEPASLPLDMTASLAGVRVLIVDDNLTNRLILTDLLSSWDMQATAVGSGLEAVAYLNHASERNEPYSLVLTDLHMPEMDGFDLVEQIQGGPCTTRTFILMLTSGERKGDLHRCREMGISAYLTKPVRRAELRSCIVTALADQPRRNTPVESSRTSVPSRKHRSGSGLHVLVIDDNVSNQRVMTVILERAGHKVTLAGDGKAAIALVEGGMFDVILMDIQMPEMDGFETTLAIREIQRRMGVYTPIVAMTALAMTGDRDRCLRAGMDDYISKPIHIATLVQVLAEHTSPRANHA
ncbi:MAG: response regulator [Acidobacteriota bacterium]